MQWRAVLAATSMASIASTAQSAVESFDMAKEVNAAYADETIDADIKVYLEGETTPDFVEVTRPDVYSGTSISLSPFGGSRRHCLDAFEKSLRSMATTARARGYDAIIGLKQVQDGKPAANGSAFQCSPGYKVTRVTLSGTFAMSAVAAFKESESDKQSMMPSSRKPAEGVLSISIEPMLASGELAAVLGSPVTLHWGLPAPAYAYREGPDEYSEEADITKDGIEAACRQAVIKVMRTLADEAATKHFDAVIRVRSYLNKRYPPSMQDVECQAEKKVVSVTLQATLAQKK